MEWNVEVSQMWSSRDMIILFFVSLIIVDF